MADESEARLTLWLSKPVKQQVEERYLGYGDSLSEYVREGTQFRMFCEDALEYSGMELPADDEARLSLFLEIAFAGVAAVEESQSTDEEVEESSEGVEQ